MIFLLELIAGVIIAGAVAIFFYRADTGNIEKLEKLCRNRNIGLFFTLPSALLCVPLAIPVSPEFLLRWLWITAVVLPVLCYFYIDSYASRGFSFFLILLAYDIIHGTFELHTPGAPVIAVAAMLWGIAGICFAARPCLIRDLFRCAAASRRWKYFLTGGAAAVSLMSLYVLLTTLFGVSA
ncbi:MAG: hypothetical protein J6S43_05015 [Lentisphaeria bacterium]|nr:hypothetical protein [Lentisphaeria bacterium]